MANRRLVKRGAGVADPGAGPRAVRWPWLLSDSGVLTSALVVAGVGVVALLIMLRIAGDAPDAERAKLQIEALKYGLGFLAAGGAVAALLLAVRRQRLSEHTHELALAAQRLSERNHQLAMKAQAHTETDAAERRVTDLYTKAVEQLGSADAAVRLGGLYALERVAQNNPGQRQTIVNVLCAYLRMPYSPAADTPPAGAAEPAPAGPLTALPIGNRAPAPAGGRDPHQELQVRLTAQRILITHLTLPSDVASTDAAALSPDPMRPFWPAIDLDLTGATLIDWNATRGHVREAVFDGATFTGDTSFGEATFTGGARFSRVTFTGDAWFTKATFNGNALFGGAAFAGDVRFHGTAFSRHASFSGATFAGGAEFSEAVFTGDAWFTKATFTGGAWFIRAAFTGDAGFDEATFAAAVFTDAAFTGDARFSKATFTRYVWFTDATVTGGASFSGATFTGDARFDGVTLAGNGVSAFLDARVGERDNRLDYWPSGWRPVSGPETTRLVYDTPATDTCTEPASSGSDGADWSVRRGPAG